MPEGGLDETMSEGLHDICYLNARVEADRYIAGLRAARAEAGADAWIGARIRGLLQPGVKRKTWRREELQRIVDQADARGTQTAPDTRNWRDTPAQEQHS